MIKISVDEGYAFDFLSILHLKNELRNNLHEVISQCETDIKSDIGEEKFNLIINSKEFAELFAANKKTFDLVDLAKEDKCTAKEVDLSNYNRYIAKYNLQNKFFNSNVTECKIGYEKYE